MQPINVYNDSYMKYDYELHHYILTPEASKKYLGVDIFTKYQTESIALSELLIQSNQVYSYLYSQVMTGCKSQLEYLIATGGRFRDAIFQALLGQLEYALESRGNDVPKQHGVLLSKGIVMPIEQLRGRVQVSLKTEQSLQAVGLTYAGFYSWSVPSSKYRVGY